MTETPKLLPQALSQFFRLARRVSYAVTIAVITWLTFDRGSVLQVLALVLDLPVAVVGRVTGDWRWTKGIDLIFGRGVGEFMPIDQMFVWHLRATVLAYLVLFYGWDLLRLVRSKRQKTS